MLSVIIPARDEAELIAATVVAIRDACESLGEPFEVIVVDDGSTDDTAAIAEAHGARVVSTDGRQISAARNAGAATARGDRFVFVDADTIVNRSVIRAAVDALRDGAVAGGSMVEFDPPVPLYIRLLLPVALWVNRRIKSAAGCFVFCTRDAFESIRGFDETLFAGEEVVFSKKMRRQGRFVVLRESVQTSGRKLRAHSAWKILGTAARLAIAGKRAASSRRGLDLWYGPDAKG